MYIILVEALTCTHHIATNSFPSKLLILYSVLLFLNNLCIILFKQFLKIL